MPDPDEGMEYPKKRYQIFLKSTSGPVEVFLVSLHEKLDEQAEKAAEPSCVLPSSKVASMSDALGGQPADVAAGRRPAAPTAAHSTRAVVKPEHIPAGAGAYPSGGSGGEGNGNSPAILRIMPPSCDPDYWFSDEVKEYGIGLNEIFDTDRPDDDEW